MIYVDAAHDYESVKKDAEACKRTMSPDGILIFNGYTHFSGYDNVYYGVVPVVNDLIVNGGFEVLAFSLGWELYADIAIRRRRPT